MTGSYTSFDIVVRITAVREAAQINKLGRSEETISETGQ